MTDLIIENELDVAQKILNDRLLLKRISQLSYEIKEIDKMFGNSYYEIDKSDKLLDLYKDIKNEVLAIAEDIKKE